MKPTRTAKPSKLDLASAVSSLVEDIRDIRMVECSARVADSIGTTLAVSFTVGAQAKLGKDPRNVTVIAKCVLDGTNEGAKDPSLQIRATFRLSYRLRDTANLTTENFAAFAQLNGIFNIWPYWRETVQAMTNRMGLPSLTVPVYRPGMTGAQGTVEAGSPQQ